MRSLLRPKNQVSVSVGGMPRLLSPFGPKSGTTAQLEAMGSVGTLFAIVNKTSGGTSQVNWHLYRKPLDNGQAVSREEREEVTRHLALDVWNKWNSFTTRQEGVEATQQHVDLTGEGWWLIAKNPFGWPEEIWPIRPDRIEPVPHPTEFISGYVYKGPDGEKVPLGVDQVIQLRMPNPLDPYRGLGPVQSILTDLDSTKYSAEWNLNFFKNSAEPGGIIEVDRRLDDTEFEEMRQRWNEQHRGVSNAHRVAILEHGKWVDRQFSMRDMQFVQLRDVSREIIREAFGFHKGLLGGSEVGHSRAELEAVLVYFAEWILKPRLERIKGALNNDFLPLFGETGKGVEFDYDDPSPENREADNASLTARAQAASVLKSAGWNADDVLTVVGLPEMRYGADAGEGVTV